jgi:hypothetical protein
MKNFLILIITGMVYSTSVFSQIRLVNITITQTSNYCGGVRPTEEMLAELNHPQPVSANQVFYIVKGKSHNYKYYKKVITDETGSINIKLPLGSYGLYSEAQLKKFQKRINTEEQTWDNDCLLKAHKKPLIIFDNKRTKKVQVNIHKKCFYSQDCGVYNGPLPA